MRLHLDRNQFGHLDGNSIAVSADRSLHRHRAGLLEIVRTGPGKSPADAAGGAGVKPFTITRCRLRDASLTVSRFALAATAYGSTRPASLTHPGGFFFCSFGPGDLLGLPFRPLLSKCDRFHWLGNRAAQRRSCRL